MAPAKHLLVDGNNIVHSWPELRRVRSAEGPALARARLVERLRVLHDFAQLRVSVVFDGRGNEIAIERPTPHATFSVIYSPSGMTADDVIEQLAAQARGSTEILVATDDGAERTTVEAAGAQVLSSDQLAAWVDRAGREQTESVQRHSRAVEARWRGQGEGGASIAIRGRGRRR